MVSMKNEVAITGMGIVCSAGDIVAFSNALYRGKSHFTKSDSYPELSFPVLGAFIEESNVLPIVSPSFILKKPKIIQLAFSAVSQAWQQSRINFNELDSHRIGLVVAGQSLASHYQYDLMDTFKQTPDYLSPSYALNYMDTDHVGSLSEAFGILGEGFTLGGASASSNVALLQAYRLIRDEWLDACLVVGALADLSPMDLQGFHNIGALGGHRFADQPDKACRPFDNSHEGFIYGQAAACLIIESVHSAAKRKASILGYMLGGAMVLDGNYQSNPNCAGELRVMEQALKNSCLSVNEINYINTHGTSSPLGDHTELEAIEQLFGKDRKYFRINSTKSIVGHCLWSAGIVEAIAILIQMKKGFVHPNLNLDNPISKNNLFVGKKSENFVIQNALSNGFGFGGINTSIIFSNSNK